VVVIVVAIVTVVVGFIIVVVVDDAPEICTFKSTKWTSDPLLEVTRRTKLPIDDVG
jgi:hypothetical protein